jgi:hypothetical protein
MYCCAKTDCDTAGLNEVGGLIQYAVSRTDCLRLKWGPGTGIGLSGADFLKVHFTALYKKLF